MSRVTFGVVGCILLVSLVLVQPADSVRCWNYCDGNDDPTGYCSDRHEQNYCDSDSGCRKTTWDHTDIVDRSCVSPTDPGGVYVGFCYDGEYDGNAIFSCQCNDGDLCNGVSRVTLSLVPLILSLLATLM